MARDSVFSVPHAVRVLQYALYQALVAPATSSCLAAMRHNGTFAVWGPAGMVRWIAPRQGQWCYAGSAGKFDAAFLIDWGARHAPRMRTRWACQRRGGHSGLGGLSGPAGCVRMSTLGGSTGCLSASRRCVHVCLVLCRTRLECSSARGGCQLPRPFGTFTLPAACSPQRWITSTLLHQSFSHLASNCAMLGGFGWQARRRQRSHVSLGSQPRGSSLQSDCNRGFWLTFTAATARLVWASRRGHRSQLSCCYPCTCLQLEAKHGSWRMALLFLLSGLGGNLLRCRGGARPGKRRRGCGA